MRTVDRQYNNYKRERKDEETLQQAIYAITCKDNFSFATELGLRGLRPLKCSWGKCQVCPSYNFGLTESKLTGNDPHISFHHYAKVLFCFEHSALPVGIETCPICDKNEAEGKKKPKVTQSLRLVKKLYPILHS